MKKNIWIICLFFLLGNTLSAQMVYPGDVDNNGEVNHLDLLYIGLANGAVGPPRATPGISWQPNSITNWGINLPNTGLDYAYADCNGDGIINFADTDAIYMNYGLTHVMPTPITFIEGTPGLNPELFFDSLGFINPFLQTGFVVTNISLGTSSLPATDFYGISFTIEYDPNVFCDVNPSCFVGFNSNLNPIFDPTGFSYFEVTNFKNNDATSGELQVTIVKNDLTPIEGFGNIGTFNAIIEDNVVDLYGSGFELNTSLIIKDIKLIDNNFNETPTVSDTINVHIIDPDTLLSSIENLDLGINIFPNPVQDIFTIESLHNPILQVHLLDLNGQTVYFNEPKSNSSNTEKIELFLQDFPEGVYFVKLLTEKGNLIKKITVLRE